MLSDVFAVTGSKLQGSLRYRLRNKWAVAPPSRRGLEMLNQGHVSLPFPP